jgi:hypothetical protein
VLSDSSQYLNFTFNEWEGVGSVTYAVDHGTTTTNLSYGPGNVGAALATAEINASIVPVLYINRLGAFIKLTVGADIDFTTYRPLRTQTTVSSSTGTLNLSSYTSESYYCQLTENITTINGPTVPAANRTATFTIFIRQDAAGSGFTVDNGAGTPPVRLAGGTFTPTATANSVDSITFRYDAFLGQWSEIGRALDIKQ